MLKQMKSQLEWWRYRIWCKLRSRTRGIRGSCHSPSLPKAADGKVLIHLGCGEVDSPEFINVDARPRPHVHHVCDVTDLSVFSDDCADLIYACHVLEHVPHALLKRTLWEWRRVLKSGGVLRLSVPDFDRILNIYEDSRHDMASILPPLMGGQSYEHNVHRCAFNRAYLTSKLQEVNFTEIRPWEPDGVAHHAFKDWANTDVSVQGRAYPISLNIEAVK